MKFGPAGCLRALTVFNLLLVVGILLSAIRYQAGPAAPQFVVVRPARFADPLDDS